MEAIHPSQSAGRDTVEPTNSDSEGSTGHVVRGESRPTDTPPPKSFYDLALQVAFAIYQDIHVKGSGLVFFALLGYGALHPEKKEPCQQLAALAGTYLFGAAINRK
jgi:hypothetical protein